jgi:predicted amidophosphoribosyltransferase
MGIAIFFVLAVIAAAAIVYPLLPGRTASLRAPTVAEEDIERAVRNLRQARRRDGLFCPTCGQAYQPADRFCVQCGGTLSQLQAATESPACPSCGATIGERDQFCAKCGHGIAPEEVA